MRVLFFKKQNRLEKLFLIVVLIYAFLIRVWKLAVLPSVVNGDESGSIIHPLQILLGKVPSLFNLTHDGSVSYLVYYPKALSISLLGLGNSLFAVRLVTVLMSVAALIPFYLLIRSRTNSTLSLVITVAFASNYWYLNFSRLSWINVDSVFWSLLSLWIMEKIIKRGRLRDFLMGGVLSALVFYNYMGGRIYFFAAGITLLFWLLSGRQRAVFLKRIKKISLYFIVCTLVFLPQLLVIAKNPNQYLIRAKTLSVFSQQGLYYGHQPQEYTKILLHQFNYSLKGFLFFDPPVSSEGIENQRLVPPGKAAVNGLIKLFFWGGLLISLFKKKGHFLWWLIYGLNILLLQIPSVFVPAWGRAIGVIPIIYLFAGLAAEELYSFLKTKLGGWLLVLLVLVFLISSYFDFSTYWQWVDSQSFNLAQRPTIEVSQFQDWQRHQIKWIKAGRFPFTFYQWQDPFWREKNLLD
jgi:4-amino-4-deoxy-L-arabinose transferase-like glycosyltransferase